jgi:hypothetical protein
MAGKELAPYFGRVRLPPRGIPEAPGSPNEGQRRHLALADSSMPGPWT